MIISALARLLAFAGLMTYAAGAFAQTLEIYAGQKRFADAPAGSVGISPSAILAAPGGYLYVNDTGGIPMRVNLAEGTVTALPATSGGSNYHFTSAYGLALDPAGIPHTAALGQLRRINGDGTSTSVGSFPYSRPMAFAADGSLYFLPGDSTVAVRRPSGVIETIAGYEEPGFAGDGGPASAALLAYPQQIAIGPNGDIYVADTDNHRIRVISATTGLIDTFAGTGNTGVPVDGLHASQTDIAQPLGLAFDAAGNLHVGVWGARRIVKIDAVSGLVSLVAGSGHYTMSGEGLPGLETGVGWPRFLTIDAAGNLYYSDQDRYHVIRKIDAGTGIVTTILGGYPHQGYCGIDGVPADQHCLMQPWSLDSDAAGNLTVVDISARQLRTVAAGTRTMSTISMPQTPMGIDRDAAGNLYVSLWGQPGRVVKIDAITQQITTFAGGGTTFGDGVPATSAPLGMPGHLRFGPDGDLYISDSSFSRIQRVDMETGLIYTFASVSNLGGFEFDANGDVVYSTDCRLRKIDKVTKAHTTIAGTFVCLSSDIPGGTPALSTNLGRTTAFQIEPDGTILLAWYQQIYRFDTTTGIIARVPVSNGVLTTPEGETLFRPGKMELDKAGNLFISQETYPRQFVFKVSGLSDPTPPAITPNISGVQGTAGWYRSDVQVGWSVNDPESSLSATSGCMTNSVTADTSGITFTCSATSRGGTATRSVTIRRDTVAPTLTFGAVLPPDNDDWYTAAVSVPFSAEDELSGVYSTSSGSPLVISNQGREVRDRVIVTDLAGNEATFWTQDFSIDLTPPVITYHLDGANGNNGWYTSDVRVSWETEDDISPILSIDSCHDSMVTADTAGTTFTCAVSSGGGTTTKTVTVRRDATPPRVDFGAPDPAPNANGWFSGDVSFPFTTSDAMSGVAQLEGSNPAVVSGDGVGLSTEVSLIDNAGNLAFHSTPATNIDRQPPTVVAQVTGLAGNGGWYRSDVQIAWVVDESPASILSTQGCAPTVVNADTAGISFTCSVISGGGTASASVTIKRDATPPVLTFGTPSPVPNVNGWNKTNVSIPFTRSDAMSGIASVSPLSPVVLSDQGAGVTRDVTVMDVAGNSATFTTVARNIDQTRPMVTIASPAPDATYGFYQDVVAGFACTDISLSTCTAPVMNGALVNTRTVGLRTFKVTGKDLVGFTTAVTNPYTVEPSFNFEGFLSPMNPPPTLNLVARGSVVPIRWKLPDGHGGHVTNTASFASATVGSLSCGSAPVVPLGDAAVGAGGISFDATTNTFTYNWQTGANWSGCRKLSLKLRDGSLRELRFRFQ